MRFVALLAGGVEVQAHTDPGLCRAEKVVQDVRALMPEMERRLVVIEDVSRKETIETKELSAARLVCRDETFLSIGPDSRVRLAQPSGRSGRRQAIHGRCRAGSVQGRLGPPALGA